MFSIQPAVAGVYALAEAPMTWIESNFAQPAVLALLVVVPGLVLVRWLGTRPRLVRMAVLAGGHQLATLDPRRRFWLIAAQLLALGLLIVGSAGPRWGRIGQAPVAAGRDIVVALDLSRSMLAEDRPPESRLDRAKQYLLELSNLLQKRGGYRVGLVAFAGQSRILAELSDDYDSFRYAVTQAHPDLLGVQGRIGYKEDGLSFGTSLRAGLEQALEVHDPEFRGFQEILVVSDGDDLAGDWRLAVNDAQKAGVLVSILGVGDPFRDALIPTGQRDNPYVVHEGQRVRTRRQDRILREIVNATGGLFLGEEESSQPAAFWFQTEVANRPAREWEEHRRPMPVDRSVWFLGAAFILLVLELACSDRRRDP